MARKKAVVEAENEVKNTTEEPVVGVSTAVDETPEERSIAQKLLSLYNLQQIYSQIDRIRTIRGELPEEIQDLEDELAGMETRIEKYKSDITELQSKVAAEETKVKDATALIARYTEQQNNVRNNREYESLTKEIDYQKLEIQVSEKHKGKFLAEIDVKSVEIANSQEKLAELAETLEHKKSELSSIVAETEKDEAILVEEAEKHKALVETRLLTAFERIRNNARNGLGIVQIERDACGGCFSTIPPQRQLDIRLHKKIIVCEACGRIFIDKQLVEAQQKTEE